MSIAVVDAREWQTLFDLRTGKKIFEDGPVIRMVQGVLERHPYPGDVDQQSNRWVSDTALDVIERYRPQFVFLSYAHQFFSSRFTPLSDAERKTMMEEVFSEAERFVRESGFVPVIVGTGDMTPIIGDIDLSRLDGLGVTSNWSARYAGLHDPSKRDMAFVASHPRIERVVSRNEWFELFGSVPAEPRRVPDYLLVAQEGWTYKAGGTPLRRTSWVPARSSSIPYMTPLGKVDAITDIAGLVEARLTHQPIALILIEGAGTRDFPQPCDLCSNGIEWFYYEPGEGQYLTLATGEHRIFDYPPGYKSYEEDDEKKEYPFSGYFRSIPSSTLGARFRGRSLAVGNRSMFMHMIPGADLSVECFARNLYNQGTMAVIHRMDKE